MSAHPKNLEEIQRTMAAAVMQPLTSDENMRAIAEDGRSMEAVAASFVAPNSRLSAFERLEIYNRQYWYRVLGALLEDFPGLRAVVGAKAFEALSIAYLNEHPSRSFTLRNLGSKLAEWLAAHPKFAGRRHRLAVDVARMEWAFVRMLPPQPEARSKSHEEFLECSAADCGSDWIDGRNCCSPGSNAGNDGERHIGEGGEGRPDVHRRRQAGEALL